MGAMSAIIGLVRWRYHGKAEAGAMLGIGFGLSYVVTSALIFVLKHFLSWGRPAYVLPSGKVMVVVPLEDGFSFPSGHAALAVTVTAVLWPHLTLRGRAIALSLATWVVLSRVVLGAHFPVDVTAGLITGAVSGWCVRRFLARIATE